MEEMIKRCIRCGTTLLQLQTTHRVGCSRCYDTFCHEIKTILGDTIILYGDDDPRRRLRNRLDLALMNEEYELAARIRDELAGMTADEQLRKE